MLSRNGNASKLMEGFKRLEADLNKRHQALVRAILTDLVVNSPQWSGTLATQWYVESKGRKARYKGKPGGANAWRQITPFMRGDDPAVSSALLRESSAIDNLRYDMPVRIVNKAPYAGDVEQGMESGDGTMPNGAKIRMDNLLPYYGGIGMIGYVDMKYRLNGGAKGVLAHGSRY